MIRMGQMKLSDIILRMEILVMEQIMRVFAGVFLCFNNGTKNMGYCDLRVGVQIVKKGN